MGMLATRLVPCQWSFFFCFHATSLAFPQAEKPTAVAIARFPTSGYVNIPSRDCIKLATDQLSSDCASYFVYLHTQHVKVRCSKFIANRRYRINGARLLALW